MKFSRLFTDKDTLYFFLKLCSLFLVTFIASAIVLNPNDNSSITISSIKNVPIIANFVKTLTPEQSISTTTDHSNGSLINKHLPENYTPNVRKNRSSESTVLTNPNNQNTGHSKIISPRHYSQNSSNSTQPSKLPRYRNLVIRSKEPSTSTSTVALNKIDEGTVINITNSETPTPENLFQMQESTDPNQNLGVTRGTRLDVSIRKDCPPLTRFLERDHGNVTTIQQSLGCII